MFYNNRKTWDMSFYTGQYLNLFLEAKTDIFAPKSTISNRMMVPMTFNLACFSFASTLFEKKMYI